MENINNKLYRLGMGKIDIASGAAVFVQISKKKILNYEIIIQENVWYERIFISIKIPELVYK